MGKLITDKCQEFKVRGEVVNIRTGPVITTYEFRLDSGVKIAAVQNLAEDLALALRTESVRIERIPGRATVGIEVPCPDPEVIRLRHLVESPEFQRAQSLLTLSLGVDIRGKPFFTDLSRMPHLLIGGFTGSGKSVGLNAMIMSVLFKARPDEVKFILVDPKMVELGVYADIPHLLTPIISNPKKAANALGWAVAEMDQRYHVLAALGVRNLQQYNQLLRDPVQVRRARKRLAEDSNGEEPALEPMPYIVVIIDELADLMITSSRAVEESITRLAQKARAVGVHLVCATQRPSVDILTGIIKANFPCRIAYKVRSRFDSRTILDSMGAEHLLGRGDMLFLPPGSANLMRLHGPLVSEKEIHAVVRYVKRFGKPDYQRDVLSHAPLGPPERGGGRRTVLENEDDLEDSMYDVAARLVVKTRKASASYIQRRLRLGYTRSARLLDMMERDGLVGPPAGSKGRDVLVPEGYFGEVDETLALNGDDQDDEEN
jgi:S-DNA-T family DNA segregation ATPase FtsK/SpoIIIE